MTPVIIRMSLAPLHHGKKSASRSTTGGAAGPRWPAPIRHVPEQR
jgi:hypothetical protein